MLTTQYLDEADRLAHRIAVIDEGRVIAEGTPRELKAQVGGDRLEVQLGGSDGDEAAVRALTEIAEGRPQLEDNLLRVPLRERRGAIADAVRRLDAAGVEIEDIVVRGPTLDDVFLQLTGRHVEQDEGRRSGERGNRHVRPRQAEPASDPSATDLLVGFTVQPVMFVLLFVYVFGGAIATPGSSTPTS